MNRDLNDLAKNFAARDDLDPLWEALRESYERNGGLKGRAVIHDYPTASIPSITKLIGRTRPLSSGQAISFDVKAFNQRLCEAGTTIEAVLETKYGLLQNKPAERLSAREAREAIYEAAARHPACQDPKTAEWVAGLPSSGALTRAAREEDRLELINNVLDVLAALPQEEIELAKLSADILGDTHALDNDKPAGKLCLSALAYQQGVGNPNTADQRIELWEAAGVICDLLSSRALILNLTLEGDGPLAQHLKISKGQAEPYSATLSELNAASPLDIKDPVLWVCENPSIISSLKRELGSECPATLCTYGNPTRAVRRILEAAKRSGCTIMVQCDGDQPGLGFRKDIIKKYGAREWLPATITEGRQEEDLMAEMIGVLRCSLVH